MANYRQLRFFTLKFHVPHHSLLPADLARSQLPRLADAADRLQKRRRQWVFPVPPSFHFPTRAAGPVLGRDGAETWKGKTRGQRACV